MQPRLSIQCKAYNHCMQCSETNQPFLNVVESYSGFLCLILVVSPDLTCHSSHQSTASWGFLLLCLPPNNSPSRSNSFPSSKHCLNNLVNMSVFIHYPASHHDQASRFNEANRYFCGDCLALPQSIKTIKWTHLFLIRS